MHSGAGGGGNEGRGTFVQGEHDGVIALGSPLSRLAAHDQIEGHARLAVGSGEAEFGAAPDALGLGFCGWQEEAELEGRAVGGWLRGGDPGQGKGEGCGAKPTAGEWACRSQRGGGG